MVNIDCVKMKDGDKFKVIGFDCGYRAMSRLKSMGIVEGSIIEIITVQPLGPYVVEVGKSEYSIGRGLFNKIILEEIK